VHGVGRIVGATLALVLCATACATRDGRPPLGRDASVALLRSIERELAEDPDHDRLRSVLVQVDGRTVLEHYDHSSATDHWNIDALTMSVLSTLVGIAVHEGLIPGLDATLAELLPERAARMSAAVRRATLAQLLSMSAGFAPSGVPDRASVVSPTVHTAPFLLPDPVDHILRTPAYAPGRFFDYSEQGAHLVAAVVARAAGTSVLQYARSRLLDPLGIDSRPSDELLGTPAHLAAGDRARLGWAVDRRGLDLGWNGLRLTARDLAALGRLYLDEGRWRGKQVVPENWARVAPLTHVATGAEVAPTYGYEWWVDGEAYFGWGYGGQLLEVVPSRRLVVVVQTQQDPRNPLAGFTARKLTFLVDHVITPAVS
jgi:CubicO group peptidase (beta-lactamase class C family)